MFPAFLEFDQSPVLLSVLLFLYLVVVPRLRWVAPCCVSGSSAWEGSLVLGGCTPVLLHPGCVSSNLHKENLTEGKEEFIPTPYVAPQAD